MVQLSLHYYSMMSGLTACGGSVFGKMISFSSSGAVSEVNVPCFSCLCVAFVDDAILRRFFSCRLVVETKSTNLPF